MLVRLTRAIPPWNDTTHRLVAGASFTAEIEPDRLGVRVRSAIGNPVSLCFDEIELAEANEEERAAYYRAKDRFFNFNQKELFEMHAPAKPVKRKTKVEAIQETADTLGKASAAIRAKSSPIVPPTSDAYSDPIFVVEVALCSRHPANRVPTYAEISQRAESLEAEGQLEPIVVRSLDAGWQILSGETRWRAAQKLGWTTLKARAIECDDARALEYLALFNGQRSDLNPIQRARLVERLCLPLHEGGAALTREKAAREVGLESGAAASNLVRLLKLPEEWQERVAAGELPESFARLMVPFVEVPALFARLEELWQNESGDENEFEGKCDRRHFDSRSLLQDEIGRTLWQCTRRLDADERYYGGSEQAGMLPPELHGSYPCLLDEEAIEKHRAKLGIVTIPLDDDDGKGAKPVEVATDVKLFDRLQVLAIVAQARKSGEARAKKAGKSADAAESEASTPGKSVEELKRDHEARKEQLARVIRDWKERLMRREIVERIDAGGGGKLRDVKIRWLALYVAHRPSGVFAVHEAMTEAVPRGTPRYADVRDVILGAKEPSNRLDGITIATLRLAIASKEDDGFGVLDLDELEAIFADFECDLGGAWRRLHARRDPLLEEFFQMHRKGELIPLGRELGVHLEEKHGKEQMIAILVNRSVPLPLPACLAPPPPKRAAKKKGSRS